MSIAEYAIAMQTSSLSQTGNPPWAEYFVIALLAVVLGAFLLVFIRTSMRRSSKR